ncbi:hypothetical protein [Microbacterium sp. USTB-Y]|uniref:hypothetical protein n=1 Tax=Microbacterium sp. USTB-Y TaxID=2823692 RepID=UPI00203F3203|nr:hypothetical protein [Microbacterium sp. USTB-Y]
MDRRDYRISLVNWRTAVITLVAAVIGIGGTVLTGVLPLIDDVSDRDGVIAKRDQTIDDLHQQLESANAKLESRQERIDALTKENTELRAALPYTVSAEDVHNIRATATITLAKQGDTIDLNSTLPNLRADGYVWQDSLTYDGKSLDLGSGVSTRVLDSGVATYATCAATTGWSKSSALDPHTLQEPVTCIRLASDRYATIQVSTYDETKAVVVITVWE